MCARCVLLKEATEAVATLRVLLKDTPISIERRAAVALRQPCPNDGWEPVARFLVDGERPDWNRRRLEEALAEFDGGDQLGVVRKRSQ